jgi:energy-coupling factor transporter ATP-binding protein EcfA2
MNIIRLEINDLKRISAVTIEPKTGKPVVLTGDNGQGKSSVLDGIVLALSNTGLDDPIRHGRPSASVKLTLGSNKAEYVLERKVTKKGSYLTLTTPTGAPIPKAQTFLNGLLGNYAFDPLEFTRLKPREQVEALKAAAGLDFADLDARRATVYQERTDIGRAGKEAAAQLAAVPEPADGVPDEEVSAAELVDALQGLERVQREVEAKNKAFDEADRARVEAEQKVARIKEELLKAEQDAYGAGIAYDDCKKEWLRAKDAAPTAEQITAARDAIAGVDATNRAVRSAREHRELTKRTNDLRNKYATLSRQIEDIDAEKAAAVQNAALPIDGLELTDDGVMMGGNFFSQLSTAEQIRISTLVAMSQNPELKIILIREGALINSANMAMLAEMAAADGYQVWVEKFMEQPSDEGLHIIDGAVAFEDGQELAQP